MKIVLSGVETNNKGAELMLYAILQEIERKWSDAEVYISQNIVFCGIENIKTKVNLKHFPGESIEKALHVGGLFRLLHIPYNITPRMLMMGNIDYLLDGSGFAFSDQFHLTHESAMFYKHRLEGYKKKGAKIIFLPQAFGPFEKSGSKEVLAVLNNFATWLMPREQVSYDYLEDSGVVDMKKVKLYTDFTSLVDGVCPNKYKHLRDGICIIPNSQMINKGAISMEAYLDLLKEIVSCASATGKKVYMLNHAGWQDKELCNTIKQLVTDEIEMVTDLNALEVKGLISSAYIVITSRFHGLASALNSCVPALSTSWSHKYEELYHDYSLESYVLPLDDNAKALGEIKKLLDAEENNHIREHLKKQIPLVKEQTQRMWNTIWNIKTK